MSGASSHSSLVANSWVRAMPAVFVLIWATGYVVARVGMPHAPPLTFLSWRYALSLACFGLLMVVARPQLPQSREQWFHLGVIGVLMQAGYLGGVWMGVKAGIGAGLAALIVNLQPVLTAVWVAATLGGKSGGVTARQWLGLALGFAGVMLVMARKLGMVGEVSLLGIGLCAVALMSMTTGALYQKRWVKACDFRVAGAVQMAAAWAITAPFSLFESEPMQINGALVGSMAWSVLVLTLGGSSLLYVLIQRGAATSVTSLLYLVPPVTAVMAWLMFGESITWLTVLGMAVTAAGVALVVRAPSHVVAP